MRQAFDQHQIKQELSKFINLLQADFKQSSLSTPPQTRNVQEHPLSKKLSIIFSASEPQSSSLDKENSNPSANRSFETNEKHSEEHYRQDLIGILMGTNLNISQLKLVQKIRQYIDQLRSQNDRAFSQLQQMKNELYAQKKANDEMLNVLVKLDEQQKQLWNNYNLVTQKFEQACKKLSSVEQQFQRAKESLVALQNDNNFMKKLIYYANQNYENLEKKCSELQTHRSRGEMTDRKSAKKSSMDNLLKSAKTKKNGYSPSHSELIRSPSPENFQEIYRKMIIRTLKFKGRSGNHQN